MRILTTILLFAVPAFSAVTVSTTAMQAVISFDAPSSSVCDIDVREVYRKGTISIVGSAVTLAGAAWSPRFDGGQMTLAGGTYPFTWTDANHGTLTGRATANVSGVTYSLAGPVVDDVNATLYTGANLDSRSTGTTNGVHRVIVLGKRAAELASDGKWHSRALQANTAHQYSLCSGTITGTLATMNPPLGNTHGEAIPVDPANPGQYAWPTVDLLNRNWSTIDPLTGTLLRKINGERDSYTATGATSFPSMTGTNWTGGGAFPATYSSAGQDKLFLETGLYSNGGIDSLGHHGSFSEGINTMTPSFAAWGAGTTSANRTISVCLTIDHGACVGNSIDSALIQCTSGCTGTASAPLISSPTVILADWFTGAPTIDSTDLARRIGYVNRSGSTVTWIDATPYLNVPGDKFNLNWTANSKITINGTAYSIASVNSEASITLSGSPAGSDTNAPFIASNAGFLVWKKTTSTDLITLYSGSFNTEYEDAPQLNSGGDTMQFTSLSPAMVAGPSGEMGYHLELSNGFYWIGAESGTINRLGRAMRPYNPNPDGWAIQACATGGFWDQVNGNRFYCPGTSYNNHTYLFQFEYSGDNRDIGDMGSSVSVTVCNDPTTPTNQPCWQFTNLTPMPSPLDVQMSLAHPLWASTHFHPAYINLISRMGTSNALVFEARSGINDSLGFQFRYDLGSHTITAAASSFGTYPSTFAVMHGAGDPNDPKFANMPSHYSLGNFTVGGQDSPGFGPWYTFVDSGAISATPGICPSQPNGNPITDWPVVGSLHCTTLHLTGQPADPSPGYFNNGTVSVVSGGSMCGTFATTAPCVTGTDYFTFAMDQTQMLLSGSFYTFSFLDYAHGTLSGSPPTVSGASYKIFLEQVNSPKVPSSQSQWSALVDLAPQDLLCPSDGVPSGECGITFHDQLSNFPEITRVLIATPDVSGTGVSVVVERGWAGSGNPYRGVTSTGAGALMITMPSACQPDPIYPCQRSQVWWDTTRQYGDIMFKDLNDQGCCHGTVANDFSGTFAINGLPLSGSPVRDSTYQEATWVRPVARPGNFTAPGFFTAIEPIWHGMMGLGSLNSVETHPSHSQANAIGTPEYGWLGDAHPWLGDTNGPSTTNATGGISGTALSPGVQTGQRWKFTASQLWKMRPRYFETMASCGVNPLLDVSGPSSTLSSTSGDSYKHCHANIAGECVAGSTAGDWYVNCPRVSQGNCGFAGFGASNPDLRDICGVDQGVYAGYASQQRITQPDPDGIGGRRITSALSRYHWVHPFWNIKVLPQSEWAVVYSAWTNGQRNTVMLAKLTPFPAADGGTRTDYQVKKIPVITGPNNVIINYGYSPSLRCTPRAEGCVAGNFADFLWAGESAPGTAGTPPGVPCTTGVVCFVSIPALPQTVLYYQIVERDASNAITVTHPMQIIAVQ